MTIRQTTEYQCDVCGIEIAQPMVTNYLVGMAPALPMPPPYQFRSGGYGTSDLCEQCAAPLIEAFKARIAEVRGE